MRVDLVLLGLALAAYHADNGAYPETLAALVPRYCRAIAGDGFTTKPLVFRLEDKGYVLYSAGDNGLDDGGRASNAQPPGDDIVIRITAQSKTRLPLVGTISPRQAKAALLATGLALMATLAAVAWLVVRASRRARPDWPTPQVCRSTESVCPPGSRSFSIASQGRSEPAPAGS